METASKETLYRVLVNHTNIIESQKAVLDKIEHQVKELKMRNVISNGHQEDNDDDNLEKLSASLLQKTKLKTEAAAAGPGLKTPEQSESKNNKKF